MPVVVEMVGEASEDLALLAEGELGALVISAAIFEYKSKVGPKLIRVFVGP